jgi:hypothetical protein
MSDSGFRRLANPELLARLQNILEFVAVDPNHVEPTFRCPICCDTCFTTRVDSKGRVYGSKCKCLLEAIANKPKDAALQFRGKAKERPLDDGEGIPF